MKFHDRTQFKAIAQEIVVDLCIKFEGIRLKPYLCPAGVWTLGVGSTRHENGTPVRPTDPAITKQRAIALLEHTIVNEYMPAVMKLCPNIDTPERLAAITDFAYNLGVGRLKTSTLRKKVNARDWEAVKVELMKWTRGGGRELKGLVLRRQAECLLLN